MAMHKVLAVNVEEQLKELEKTGDPEALSKRAKKIMEGVDNLPGLVMVCAMDDMNPLKYDRAVEILAKNVEGTNVLDSKKMKLTSCDGVFWLMCTVHNYEVPSMENVTEVPTNREIISASMGFKRFYNNLAINKTDDYKKEIETILTSVGGDLNYLWDLSYLDYQSKGEPFFDFLKNVPIDLANMNKKG